MHSNQYRHYIVPIASGGLEALPPGPHRSNCTSTVIPLTEGLCSPLLHSPDTTF